MTIFPCFRGSYLLGIREQHAMGSFCTIVSPRTVPNTTNNTARWPGDGTSRFARQDVVPKPRLSISRGQADNTVDKSNVSNTLELSVRVRENWIRWSFEPKQKCMHRLGTLVYKII